MIFMFFKQNNVKSNVKNKVKNKNAFIKKKVRVSLNKNKKLSHYDEFKSAVKNFNKLRLCLKRK